MTQSISRRTILPAIAAAGVAVGVGAANASPAPASLISLETIEKARGLISSRNALIDCVRTIVGVDRLHISVNSKEKAEQDKSMFFSTYLASAHVNLNDGYDPDFKAIRDAIRNAAIAQLRRVEVKMTALGIDFESDGGIDG